MQGQQTAAHHAVNGHVVARGVGRAASVALKYCVIEESKGSPAKVEESCVQRAPIWLGSKSCIHATGSSQQPHYVWSPPCEQSLLRWLWPDAHQSNMPLTQWNTPIGIAIEAP